MQILRRTFLSCQAVFARNYCRSLVQVFLFAQFNLQAMDSGGTGTRDLATSEAQAQAHVRVRDEGFTTLSSGGQRPMIEYVCFPWLREIPLAGRVNAKQHRFHSRPRWPS